MKYHSIRSGSPLWFALLQLTVFFGTLHRSDAVNDEPCPGCQIVTSPILQSSTDPTISGISTPSGRTVIVTWTPPTVNGLFKCGPLASEEQFQGTVIADGPLSETLYNVQVGEQRTVTRTFTGSYRSPCLANGPELPCDEPLTISVTVKGLPNNGNSTGDEVYCGITYNGIGSGMENYAVGMDGSVWRWTGSSGAPRKVEDLSNVIAVESGDWGGWNSKNLALKADGTVWAWGAISEPPANQPLMVAAVQIEPLDNVKAIAVGAGYALALKNNGEVWAWGYLRDTEAYPDLDPYMVSEVPLKIQELSDIVSIRAHHYNFYALDSNKRMWGWWGGATQVSQVSNGDVISFDFNREGLLSVKTDGTVWKNLSTKVNGIAGAKSAVAFQGAVIFSKDDGSVWSTGSNLSGAVGHPTEMQVSTLLHLSDLPEVISIEPGCFAISRDGSVRNWGVKQNASTSGSVTQAFESRPSMILPETGLNDFISVASGGGEGVGVKSDGSVLVWGGDGFGREDRTLETWRGVSQVSTNGLAVARGVARLTKKHTLLLKTDKTVAAWGSNAYGELGNGNYTEQPTPLPVVGLSGIKAIACGQDHSLALTEGGKVWSWGRGNNGQLGDGLATDRWAAQEISDLDGVIAIGANVAASFALKENGELWGWGVDANGDGLKDLTPVRVGDLGGIASFAVGSYFTAALTKDGNVWLWDANSSGRQLPSTLRRVIGMENVRSIWANSASHTPYGSTLYAVKADGTLWAQGDNESGQLGNGTIESSSVPVRVGNDLFVGADARVFPGFLGGSFPRIPLTTFILKGDKTLIALGASESGQFANGQSSFSPQRELLNGVHLKAPIPSASIQALAGGGRTQIGQPVVLAASASVTAGSIAKVEFYADGVLLGEDDEAPYEYSFQSNTWGNTRIHAISVSDLGARSAPSEEVEFSVSYDFDGDSLPDWKELENYFYLDVSGADDDSDFDGVPNALEVLHGRDPFSPYPLEDLDGDGLPDDWEYVYFNDLTTSDGTQNGDGDWLTDLEEWERRLHPGFNDDSDLDGWLDVSEALVIATDHPNNHLTRPSDLFPWGDMDKDGWADALEADRGSDLFSDNDPSETTLAPLIKLKAGSPWLIPHAGGAIWLSQGGSQGRSITAFTSTASPILTTKSGMPAVEFQAGQTDCMVGPVVSPWMNGSGNRTVVAWVFNQDTDASQDDVIFSWGGSTTGPTGPLFSCRYGGNVSKGAFGQGGNGTADRGWGSNQPATGSWSFVVYSYDNRTGTLMAMRNFAAGTLQRNVFLQTAVFSEQSKPFRFVVGGENLGSGTPTALNTSLCIGELYVYDRAVPLSEIIESIYEPTRVAYGHSSALVDGDEDGLPFLLEQSLGMSDSNSDSDSDGDYDGFEFERGTDGTDFYNGEPHYVTVTEGDGQTVSRGEETPSAIKFRVTDIEGEPIVGGPINVSVLPTNAPPGNVRLDSPGSTLNPVLTPRPVTDGNGEVSIFFKGNP